MSLLPEQITNKTFPRRICGGYDPQQVDRFLQRVEVDYAAAIHRIAAVAEDRARSATARDDLAGELTMMAEQGREAVHTVRRDAEEDASAIRRQAQQSSAAMLERAEEAAAATTRQAERLRTAAQQSADAAWRRLDEAERLANEREDTARRHCEDLHARADRRREELRRLEERLLDGLREASATVSALRSQVDLADQASRLSDLISEVQASMQHNRDEPVDGTTPGT